ncbi:hypothetical protein BH20ACT9_BH20ACT9_15640 [soil metagenome]
MAVTGRNDPRQYDDLAGEWWRPGGQFAALHWLSAARARLVPTAARPDAVLVDVACGGGLMVAHTRGYLHVGVDLVASAAAVAAAHGVKAVRGRAESLPVADEVADVVVVGEVLEHVADLDAVVAEAARVLRPGGTLVCDTLNDTWRCRVAMVAVGERVPGGPPRGIHDPALFVRPERLRASFAAHGVELRLWGLRPSVRDYLAFLVDRARPVRMLPTRSLATVYQGVGTKRRVHPAGGRDRPVSSGIRGPADPAAGDGEGHRS